jgi:hypothetical protein
MPKKASKRRAVELPTTASSSARHFTTNDRINKLAQRYCELEDLTNKQQAKIETHDRALVIARPSMRLRLSGNASTNRTNRLQFSSNKSKS